MKIVISPSKALNFEKQLPTNQFSKSIFLKESKIINKIIKQKSPNELSELMDISNNLGELNWKRNKAWKTPFTADNSRPAIYAFDGDVYSGLEAYTLPLDKLGDLQSKVRILSGLYGLLKPLDLMQAYRLEMGTKLPIDESKNLYEFWKPKIAKALNKELHKNELFINLASNEYFSAVDVKALKVTVITPEFKDYKDGKLKTISFFAKKARGLMARFIIDTNGATIDDLKNFNSEGYCFDENLSKGNSLIFTR